MQLTPKEVITRLSLDEITGLTFSGGEPMEQAGALAEVARLARQKRDLDVICFTGYRYEALLNKPEVSGVHDLLQCVDVLIDGPYVSTQNDSIGLRGSENQRIIHLTDRLQNFELEHQVRNIEFKIDNGSFTMVGIPAPKIASMLMDILPESRVEGTL
jgi:anaerobic ribonucleoside-triphosphate reductase activating protein